MGEKVFFTHIPEVVVEHSLELPFFGIGMKTALFQSCGHYWVFQICWHIECSTLTFPTPPWNETQLENQRRLHLLGPSSANSIVFPFRSYRGPCKTSKPKARYHLKRVSSDTIFWKKTNGKSAADPTGIFQWPRVSFLVKNKEKKKERKKESIIMNKASGGDMEFQLSYFKSWKMMLWKCCTQYTNKFGKLSSAHRTGKGQFSFQSQRKAIPKNAQSTTQLHSSHTLVK